MILILTMAGKYQRFTDEGYKLPKYLLPWGERTVLWAILSELVSTGHFVEVHLVANRRDEDFMPHVRAIMRNCGISPENLHLVSDTRGQAETAALGIGLLPDSLKARDLPIVFHNVDTILYDRSMEVVAAALREFDGFVDVFSSNDHGYSYVLSDGAGRIREIAEKIVVSNSATSGLYGFASCTLFSAYCDVSHDIYISSVYRKMIVGGRAVVAGETFRDTNTIVLGTPSDYINASLLRYTGNGL